MTSNRNHLQMLGALLVGTLKPEDVPTSHWPTIRDMASQHGLAPMLLWKFQHNAPGLIDSPAWEPIRCEARASVVHHMLLEETQRQLARAWLDAGIPCLWLKGIVLAHTVYPRPDLRPMGDLDVLVPFEQREDALALAQQQGYAFTSYEDRIFLSTADPLQREISHHYHLAGANDITLEIHYQLAKSIASSQDSAWFWTMTQPGEHGMILRPEAHLLYLCAHAMIQHGEQNISLQRFYDMHLLVTTYHMDWQLILDNAAALKWTCAVEQALALSIGYFGTPVSEQILEELRAARPADEDVRIVEDLRHPGSRWPRARRKLKQMSFPTQLNYLKAALIPPPAYMRHRYHIQPNAAVWPYYLYRWLDQSLDIGAWIWWRIRRQ